MLSRIQASFIFILRYILNDAFYEDTDL